MAEKGSSKLQHPNAALLQSATKGFDFLFSNDLVGARAHFEKGDDPFHLMGLGVCAFLEAALGMESALMAEASRCLAASEAGARKQMRVTKPRDIQYMSRFPHGLEWEILNADAVVLLGMTHALSESYIGYMQCMYALNNAHTKFGKLYKTVFPNGLPSSEPLSATKPLHLKSVSHQPSISSLASAASTASAATTTVPPSHTLQPPPGAGSFFSRWMGGTAAASTPILPLEQGAAEDGPVEDLIVAGTAFGFGLFNLVFSLLPKKVQGVVGFFGFKSDRKLALQALALAASKDDVHGVFAGLVLMTYQGVVLLLSGYQADEQRLLREYKAVVDKIEARYPNGALWILNRAKIMRMGYDAEGAINVLKDGLKPERTHSFVQADMLLIFELAWTLLGQRRYQEAADTFLRVTELNSWSHGTYYFIAAGCYISLGNVTKAQELFDAIPDLIDKKKMTGKDLPTEVFIKKKLAFYKEKQARRGGDPNKWADCVKISPAEEIGIFWNNHSRISPSIAQQHVDELSKFTPVPITGAATPSSPTASFRTAKSPILSELASLSLKSPRSSSSIDATRPPASPAPTTTNSDDLDTPDELAIRALLLGVNYRVLEQWDLARQFLNEAYGMQDKIGVSTWVGGVAVFELAVLELKEMESKSEGVKVKVKVGSEASSGASSASSSSVSVTDEDEVTEKEMTREVKKMWAEKLKAASGMLDTALGLAGSHIDLSSRLDSRNVMLRDEIAAKGEMLGVGK